MLVVYSVFFFHFEKNAKKEKKMNKTIAQQKIEFS